MELLNQPPIVCLAKNQVGWQINEQNATVTGTAAVMRLTVHSLPTAAQNTLLHFQWNEAEHEFQFYIMTDANANLAENSGIGVPEPTPGNLPPIHIWVKAVLAVWLRKNALIDTYFNVVTYNAADYLDLVAKNTGTDSEITELLQGYNIYGAVDTNFDWRSLSIATNGVGDAYNDLRIVQHVFVEKVFGSENWTKLPIAEHACDHAGNTEFDIAEKLLPYLTGYDVPEHDATAPGVCTEIQKRFRVFFDNFSLQMINSNNQVYQHNFHVALKAGVRKMHFQHIPDILEDWIKPTNEWLSWRPAERWITNNQPEFLSLLFWPERNYTTLNSPGGASTQVPDDVVVKAKIFYTDGTAETVTVHTENQLMRYQIGYFPIGYNILYPLSDQAKEIESYQVWAYLDDNLNGVVNLGKAITYILTDEGYNDRYFMYENSFGCWETLRTQGHRINTVSVEKQTLSRILPLKYGKLDSENQTKLMQWTQPNEISMVVENEDEFKPLTDFIISEKVMLIENGEMVEVSIDAGDYAAGQDDEYVYPLTFTFTYANPDKTYSQPW